MGIELVQQRTASGRGISMLDMNEPAGSGKLILKSLVRRRTQKVVWRGLNPRGESTELVGRHACQTGIRVGPDEEGEIPGQKRRRGGHSTVVGVSRTCIPTPLFDSAGGLIGVAGGGRRRRHQSRINCVGPQQLALRHSHLGLCHLCNFFDHLQRSQTLEAIRDVPDNAGSGAAGSGVGGWVAIVVAGLGRCPMIVGLRQRISFRTRSRVKDAVHLVSKSIVVRIECLIL